MNRYRYRTKVFVGAWRATPDEAAEDAVRAGQARRDAEGEPVRWLVCGRIESSADPFAPSLPEGPPLGEEDD